MEPNRIVVTEAPRPAASVVLLREASAGFEVLMLERHGGSAVLAGAHVFPGGKVDAVDASPETLGRIGAEATRALHARLADASLDVPTAVGCFVAACRETMEEAGVELRPDELHPWTRWITPRVPSMGTRRFDTRFFVARLPAGATAAHDERETVASVWLAPRDGLTRWWAGEFTLAPPQIMTLVQLARFASTEAVLAHAASRPAPLIEPEPFDVDGARIVCYPGDARHPVRERAWPGPSRLVMRAGRFEPHEGGFEAFFLD